MEKTAQKRSSRLDDNIKTDLGETGCKVVDVD
jgi:hypothetical protein